MGETPKNFREVDAISCYDCKHLLICSVLQCMKYEYIVPREVGKKFVCDEHESNIKKKEISYDKQD